MDNMNHIHGPHHMSGTLGWRDEVESVLRHGVLVVTMYSGTVAPQYATIQYTKATDDWRVLNGTPEQLPFVPDTEVRAFVEALHAQAEDAHNIIYRARTLASAAYVANQQAARKKRKKAA